jgi:hypothetical protein
MTAARFCRSFREARRITPSRLSQNRTCGPRIRLLGLICQNSSTSWAETCGETASGALRHREQGEAIQSKYQPDTWTGWIPHFRLCTATQEIGPRCPPPTPRTACSSPRSRSAIEASGRWRTGGACGNVEFSFGKTQVVLACFHVHPTIPIDLAAGGGLFELTAEPQKFGAREARFGRLVTR